MCKKSFSKSYRGVTTEDIWSLWSKSKNWLKWHTGAKSASFDKAFKVNNYIILEHEGVGTVKLFIAKMEPGKSFTAKTDFFGSKIIYTRTVEATADGVNITYEVEFQGILKWWRYLVMKNKLIDCMPHDVNMLVKIAKEEHPSK